MKWFSVPPLVILKEGATCLATCLSACSMGATWTVAANFARTPALALLWHRVVAGAAAAKRGACIYATCCTYKWVISSSKWVISDFK